MVFSSVGASLWDWWTGTFGSGRLIWDESRWSFGEASAKDASRKATYPWFEAEFSLIHRSTSSLSSPYQKTPWRPLFVYKWRHVRTTTTCTPSATIRTSRRTIVVERHGRRRFFLLVCNKVTNDNRTDKALTFRTSFRWTQTLNC